MPKKARSFALKLFTLLIFVVVAVATLFFANGYQVDVSKRDVRKTSIIDVRGEYKDLSLMLDSIQQATTDLPFQIKNVLPGNYEVSVIKEGYLPWVRKIKVDSDLVAIVTDVLLVPQNLSKYVKYLKSFENDYKFFVGKDMLVMLKTGDGSLRLVSFFDDGSFKEEELTLFRKGIATVAVLPKDRFMISFADGSGAWLSFPDRNFQQFALQDHAYAVKVNPDVQALYFMINKALYRVPFAKLGDKTGVLTQYKIRDNVEAYAFGLDGDIYFISSGMLYKTNEQGTEIALLDRSLANYKNIATVTGSDYGAIILRNKDDRRILCLFDRHGHLKLLDADLKGQPMMNNFDQMIYANNGGEINFLDPNVDEKSLIVKQNGDFDLIGWFGDEGHFLIKKDDAIYLSDVFNANTYKLLDSKNITNLFVVNKALFYLEGSKLYSLDFQE